MRLIRKVQKTTGNPPFLKDIEETHALWHGKTIVFVTVDDKHGGIPLKDVLGSRGIPAEVVLAVDPDCAVILYWYCLLAWGIWKGMGGIGGEYFMLCKPQLIRVVFWNAKERTIVADESFELAA